MKKDNTVGMEKDASAKATLERIDRWAKENPGAVTHPVWEDIMYQSMSDEGYAALYGGEPEDAEKIYLARIEQREADYQAARAREEARND